MLRRSIVEDSGSFVRQSLRMSVRASIRESTVKVASSTDQEYMPVTAHISQPQVVNKSGMLSDGLIDSSDSKLIEVDLQEGQEIDSVKGLTAFEGSLALLSVIIGGGIVGIPYAMY